MGQLKIGNVLNDIPRGLAGEQFSAIASGRGVRIERIVSAGHATPQGEWYDQDGDEWVLLLGGRARLAFGDGLPDMELSPGDHVLIPARCRHRVAWTDPVEPTVWIAVHFDVE